MRTGPIFCHTLAGTVICGSGIGAQAWCWEVFCIRTKIFHSVNAALYFYRGGHGLLVDGVHQKGAFSAMPAPLRADMAAGAGIFARLDGLVYTHLHADHYDANTASAFAARLTVPVWGPGLAADGLALSAVAPGVTRAEFPGFTVLAADTVHDGKAYRGEPHRSLFVHCGDECFFVAGDALLRPEDAAAFRQFAPRPDAAFVNVYQLSGDSGRAFLRALYPKRTFLYHMPLPEDDTHGYHRFVPDVALRFPPELGPLQIPAHMAWIDDSRPSL